MPPCRNTCRRWSFDLRNGFLPSQGNARPVLLRRQEPMDVSDAYILDLSLWRSFPAEIRRRVLLAVMAQVSPKPYPPRSDAVDGLMRALEQKGFKGRTLAGCRFCAESKGKVKITEEYSLSSSRRSEATRDLACRPFEDPSLDARDDDMGKFFQPLFTA